MFLFLFVVCYGGGYFFKGFRVGEEFLGQKLWIGKILNKINKLQFRS